MAVTQEEKVLHQLDAERAVIGSLLIDPEIATALLSTVKDGDMLNPVDRQILQTARKLGREGKPVDAMSIRDRMGLQYSQYMTELMEITPTSANWREYARMAHDQAALVRVHQLADRLMLAVTLDDCRPVLADLEQQVSTGSTVDSWSLAEMMEDFLKSQDPDTPAPDYLKTGYPWLDNGVYIRPGSFVLLGGDPSAGKTAMALSMAYAMAKDHKVGFFSLETGKEVVRDRLVSATASVDMGRVQSRKMTDADWSSVAEVTPAFSARSMRMIQAGGMGVDQIAALSRAYGFEVILVDYVQLIEPYSRKSNRTEQMGEVSRALHTFAQTSGVTVIGLVQLSRQEDKGKPREPTMRDIRESGQFEQDADLIFMLSVPIKADDPQRDRLLRVVKNKQGRLGRWALDFDGPTQTFCRRAEHSYAGNPYVAKGERVKAARSASTTKEVPGQGKIVELPMTAAQRREMESVFPADGGGF